MTLSLHVHTLLHALWDAYAYTKPLPNHSDITLGYASRYNDDLFLFDPNHKVILEPFDFLEPNSAHERLICVRHAETLGNAWDDLITCLRGLGGWWAGPHTDFSVGVFHDCIHFYFCGHLLQCIEIPLVETQPPSQAAADSLAAFLTLLTRLAPAIHYYQRESDFPAIGAGTGKDALVLLRMVENARVLEMDDPIALLSKNIPVAIWQLVTP